jgi:hypothetical protein
MSYQSIYQDDNFAKINTGFTDESLAIYFVDVFLPQVNAEMAKKQLEPIAAKSEVAALKSGTLQGEHAWGHLAWYFVTFGNKLGLNFELAYAYCLQRRRAYRV